MTQVKYEWSEETLDENEDIIDSQFSDTLKELMINATGRICLVRNEGSESEGVTDRFWAYITNNQLPEYFEDGQGHTISIKVPQKYHKELRSFLNK